MISQRVLPFVHYLHYMTWKPKSQYDKLYKKIKTVVIVNYFNTLSVQGKWCFNIERKGEVRHEKGDAFPLDSDVFAMVLCAIPPSVCAEIADALAEESVEHEDLKIVDTEVYVLGEMLTCERK